VLAVSLLASPARADGGLRCCVRPAPALRAPCALAQRVAAMSPLLRPLPLSRPLHSAFARLHRPDAGLASRHAALRAAAPRGARAMSGGGTPPKATGDAGDAQLSAPASRLAAHRPTPLAPPPPPLVAASWMDEVRAAGGRGARGARRSARLFRGCVFGASSRGAPAYLAPGLVLARVHGHARLLQPLAQRACPGAPLSRAQAPPHTASLSRATPLLCAQMRSITAVGFDMDYTLAQARPSRCSGVGSAARVAAQSVSSLVCGFGAKAHSDAPRLSARSTSRRRLRTWRTGRRAASW